MLAPTERMDLHFGQCLERPDGICSIASVPGCDVTSEMDLKKDNGNSVLTKEERIEKGRFMNRVANMNPERRLKKLMSDRYENMSEERRIKKKESNRLLNRPENMTLERKMKKKLSDSAANMSVERKEKKKEAQRRRSLNNMKTPRVPLSNEKRDMKNEKGKQRRAAKKALNGSTDPLDLESDGGEENQNNSSLMAMSMSMSPTSLNTSNFGLGNILEKSLRNVPQLIPCSLGLSSGDVELSRLELNAELNSSIENFHDNNMRSRDNENVDSDSEEEGERDKERGGESLLHAIGVTVMKGGEDHSSDMISNSNDDYESHIENNNITTSTSTSIGTHVNDSQNHNVSDSPLTPTSSSTTNVHHTVNTRAFTTPAPTPSSNLLLNAVLINHNSAAVPVDDDISTINDGDNIYIPYPTSTSSVTAQEIILSHKRNRSVRDEKN